MTTRKSTTIVPSFEVVVSGEAALYVLYTYRGETAHKRAIDRLVALRRKQPETKYTVIDATNYDNAA